MRGATLAVLLLAVAAGGAAATEAGTPAGGGAASPPIRLAQITLQFGVPDELVYRVLSRQGYDEIEIVQRGLARVRVQACLDGVRYRMEITPRGDIQSRDRVGDCRRPIDLRQARRMLEREGYRDIEIEERRDGFAAIACRGRDRHRVAMDRFGSISESRAVGPCGATLSAEEIAVLLRSLGYTRVRVTDPKPPRMLAEACREDQRVELSLSPTGTIVTWRPIGRCNPPIDPRAIPKLLSEQGFTRVEMIDERPPRYLARACRADTRVELVIDRFGDIADERRVGRCPPPLTQQQVVARLQELGYRRVEVVEQTREAYVVEGCEARERVRLRLTVYGETLDEQRLGRCVGPTVEEVVRQFERGGLSEASLLIEGCRRGQRLRIALDEYGEAAETTVVGRCR